jgi:hypothetical protein
MKALDLRRGPSGGPTPALPFTARWLTHASMADFEKR